ncbi:MAG TPA: DUF1501 domain-containing protein, partial [Gemmataceae bacterium]|nr:DUF1501 domain-containing protein [Gemmataceae bacterium]
MLRVVGGSGSNCAGITRRNFVRAGLAGLGGLGLADLFRLQAAPSAERAKGAAVILFWLSGGPGHMETWDPKPDAVAQFRGPFGAIRTAVPGVQFGELLPEQARLADRLAVLRTVNHGSGDHTKSNHWMLTGFEGPAFNAADFMVQRRPSMGSAVAKLRGPNRPGLPPYVAVPHLRGGTDNFFHYAAYLGAAANPFIVESDPNTPQFRVKNLALPKDLPLARLEDRRHVLDALDGLRRQGDRGVSDMDQHYQRAFSLLTGRETAKAFDVGAEPEKVRERYGRHTFGQSALLARRLVEAGVTFVTVNCVPWDHHGTAGRPRTDVGGKLLIPPFDRALAALVEDLAQRGLYERTLVVAMGEFGRTPRLSHNANGTGRDHWPDAMTVLLSGGGLRTGQVVGATNARAEYPTQRPYSPKDILATIYRHLGID